MEIRAPRWKGTVLRISGATRLILLLSNTTETANKQCFHKFSLLRCKILAVYTEGGHMKKYLS